MRCLVAASDRRIKLRELMGSGGTSPQAHENQDIVTMLKNMGPVTQLTKANLGNWLMWERSLKTLIHTTRGAFTLTGDGQFIFWIWSQVSIEIQELADNCRPALLQTKTVDTYFLLLKNTLRPTGHSAMPRFNFLQAKQKLDKTVVAYWQRLSLLSEDADFVDDRIFIETYLKGLLSTYVQAEMIVLKPKTPAECLTKAQEALDIVVAKMKSKTIRHASLEGILFASDVANAHIKKYLSGSQTRKYSPPVPSSNPKKTTGLNEMQSSGSQGPKMKSKCEVGLVTSQCLAWIQIEPRAVGRTPPHCGKL